MLPKAGTMHNFEHAYLRLLSHLINHYRRHNGTEHNKARLNEKKQPQQQHQHQRRRRILTIDEEKRKKGEENNQTHRTQIDYNEIENQLLNTDGV